MSHNPDTSAPSHAHHWIIQPAEGPVSQGKCKICKISKDFANSMFPESRSINLAKETRGE